MAFVSPDQDRKEGIDLYSSSITKTLLKGCVGLLLTLIVSSTTSAGTSAGQPVELPLVGRHYPVVTFKKNENPQNVMKVYAKVDEKSCSFTGKGLNGSHPLLGFYWLLGGEHYKPVNRLIRNAIEERLSIQPDDSPRTIILKIDGLEKFQHDIVDSRVIVSAEKTDDGCQVEAVTSLGSSDKKTTIRIETLNTIARMTLLPPFRKVVSFTLEGVDVESGEKVVRTFASR